LAKDARVGLSEEDLAKILQDGQKRIGSARAQVEAFSERARTWEKKFPAAKDYSPPSIL